MIIFRKIIVKMMVKASVFKADPETKKKLVKYC